MRRALVYRITELLLRLGRVLPFGLLWSLAGPVSWLGWQLAREQRRRTLAHLVVGFPEKSAAERRALGRGVFLHLARAAVESFCADRPGEEIELSGREHLDALLSCGEPVVLLTGHFGVWELLPGFLVRAGAPLRVVARHLLDPRLDRLVQRQRERAGTEVLFVRGTETLAMARHLRRGGWLGLLLDQNTKAAGIEVPFFGRPAHTPTGAIELALATGSRVSTVFLWRAGRRRYVVEMDAPLEFPAGTPRERIDWGTAEATRRIETRVRAHPEQWVWMHRRWKDRSGRRRYQRWKDAE